jgi:hypothetical protein
MQGAFVVRLGPETDLAKQRFEGWVEEVDSGKEIRFRSTEDLIAFLGYCYQHAFERQRALKSRRSD